MFPCVCMCDEKEEEEGAHIVMKEWQVHWESVLALLMTANIHTYTQEQEQKDHTQSHTYDKHSAAHMRETEKGGGKSDGRDERKTCKWEFCLFTKYNLSL